MDGINTEFLFDLQLEVEKPVGLGPTAAGEHKVVVFTGGRFEGPLLRGAVLPGGGDWLWRTADDKLHIDVRLTMRTDDGAAIYAAYHGYRYATEEATARLNAGQAVDPSDLYFRTAFTFKTGHPDYVWLNETLAIGTGERPPGGPQFRVYRVL